MLTEVLAAVLVAAAIWVMVPSAGAVRMQALGVRDAANPIDIRTWLATRAKRSGKLSPERRLVHALRALAAELSSGGTPVKALERAAGTPPLWPRALAAAHFGESVPRGLIHDAQDTPHLDAQLRQLAACWSVGTSHGAGLVTSIERLALSVQSQFELRAVLNSELAAPRATMKMLSLLPLVGITMGYLLGADPIRWFLGSTLGAVIVIIAVLLTFIGVMWTRRIVQRVDQSLSRG